jgi:hypothetical protein
MDIAVSSKWPRLVNILFWATVQFRQVGFQRQDSRIRFDNPTGAFKRPGKKPILGKASSGPNKMGLEVVSKKREMMVAMTSSARCLCRALS